MTFNDEFIPGGVADQDEASYPSAFGITFTPQVTGIAVGILGLLGAAYIVLSFVLPAWEEYQKKQEAYNAKIQEVEGLKKSVQNIEQLQRELVVAEGQRKRVTELFGDSRNLDTLLLDVNGAVAERRAKLIVFEPVLPAQTSATNVPAPALDEPFTRQTIRLEIEGTFEQTLGVLQTIERLQILTSVKEFTTVLKEPPTVVVGQGQVSSQPPLLKTGFRLEAIVPKSQTTIPSPSPSPSPTPKK
jgi:hypothetical protein